MTRWLHRFRFVLLGVVGVGLVVATVLTLRTDGPAGVRGQLGPTPPASEGHVRAKRAYLADLVSRDSQTEAAALVSLASFVSAPVAQSMVLGMEPTWVFVRFPAAETEPLPVRTTIAGAVADRASDLRTELMAEVDAISERLAGAEGEERQELVEALAEREAALEELSADCACVFAFAMEAATVGQLAELQALGEVLLVDVPDPVVTELAGWELTPIVPAD